MKKKILTILLALTFSFSILTTTNTTDLDATSGMLKQNTVMKCKGKWYGKHKSHWHKAKKNKKNKKWYANGKSLGSKKPKACK
ncbi:hypothetical protein OKW22_001085 [Bacilli bacterium PM5-3]|nr:hypothetical protein [Bacilli bacterium PM5-3]MDH6603276.1 hypothetical protein [Bacilli bacterium PM5-9]